MTNPVEWAEQEFGAQAVFNRVQQVAQELSEVSRIRDAAQLQLRDLTWEKDEREAAIAAEVLAETKGLDKPPSDAAVGRQTKLRIGEDQLCKSLAIRIMQTRESLDKADSRVEALKVEARALSSRQQVIAGLLHFFASCKEAETAARSALVSNPASRWPM